MRQYLLVVIVSGLTIPELLLEFIERGLWPADWKQALDREESYPSRYELPTGVPDEVFERHEARMAELGPPLIPVERVHRINPGAYVLALLPPPFVTVRQRNESFWGWDFAAPGEVDPDRAMMIGDFGRGSDEPVILDYQVDRSEPTVRRLACKFVRSGGPGARHHIWDNHWVEIAPSFDRFAQMLGLP